MEKIQLITNNISALIKLVFLSTVFILVLVILSGLIYSIFISPIIERLNKND